jgi:hypothetical protein
MSKKEKEAKDCLEESYNFHHTWQNCHDQLKVLTLFLPKAARHLVDIPPLSQPLHHGNANRLFYYVLSDHMINQCQLVS